MQKVEKLYPQPIAYAYGRVLRARSDIERLDQILRCTEVVTRYAAAVCIASFAARENKNAAVPEAIQRFEGNLSFGHFLAVVQAVVKLKDKHPLLITLSQCFLGKNNPTLPHLETLIKTRNELGHDLQGLNPGLVKTILVEQRPQQLLEEILAMIEPLCQLPLFLVEAQFPRKKVYFIRRLHLMGAGEPMPTEVAVSEFFGDDGLLYIGTQEGALSLHPMVLWDLEKHRGTKGVYVIHRISETLEYRSLIQQEQPYNPPRVALMRQLTQGKLVPLEAVTLEDGRSFWAEWQETKDALTTSLRGETQTIVWTDYDKDTVQWYVKRLQQRTHSTIQNPHELLRQMLLDGRGEATHDEARQLRLLFGSGSEVKRLLRRELLDLRARLKPDTSRWDERQEIAANVLVALRQALTFISKHHPNLKTTNLDDLQSTTGSTDYIAVREALVNLIIHQDYQDERTVAQVELEPERTTMINAGYSLASNEELRDGGTSTSRNPLIARALKLIGFAELGGSGLRETYRVWRQAKRRPVLAESDKDNNRFRLVLDSRPLVLVVDSLWKERLGATVSPEEAKILSLLGAAAEGLSLDELCTGTGQRGRDVEQMSRRLVHQQLIDEDSGRYRLKGYLIELAQRSLNQ